MLRLWKENAICKCQLNCELLLLPLLMRPTNKCKTLKLIRVTTSFCLLVNSMCSPHLVYLFVHAKWSNWMAKYKRSCWKTNKPKNLVRKFGDQRTQKRLKISPKRCGTNECDARARTHTVSQSFQMTRKRNNFFCCYNFRFGSSHAHHFVPIPICQIFDEKREIIVRVFTEFTWSIF